MLMEKYLANECITVGLVFSFCCLVIFGIYLLVLRHRFLQVINSILQLTEALAVDDDPAIFNTATETMVQFRGRFAQLVIVPVHAALHFTGMFSAGERNYRYAILLLKQLGFPSHMNRLIEHRLSTVKNGWDFVAFQGTISGAGHPAIIQKVLYELLHPDTDYKIKNWKVADPIES